MIPKIMAVITNMVNFIFITLTLYTKAPCLYHLFLKITRNYFLLVILHKPAFKSIAALKLSLFLALIGSPKDL